MLRPDRSPDDERVRPREVRQRPGVQLVVVGQDGGGVVPRVVGDESLAGELADVVIALIVATLGVEGVGATHQVQGGGGEGLQHSKVILAIGLELK